MLLQSDICDHDFNNTYPMIIWVYKGEGRILFIPVIEHIAGYSIASDTYYIVQDTDNADEIGKTVLDAIEYIKKAPLSVLTPKEREDRAAWKKNTNYKSKLSFWKNNDFAQIIIYINGDYKIYSMTKSLDRKGEYEDIIKEISLSNNASVKEIGMALQEVLNASEKYYANKRIDLNRKITKTIELLDGSKLSIVKPSDKNFNDGFDHGSVEIYTCYNYISKDNGEESAVFFIGTGAELDCSLTEENILDRWKETYGTAESLLINETNNGIYSLRAEFRNKEIHKISYYMRQSDDLLLECGMEVYKPGRRKKLDEKLQEQFEEFAMGCKPD